MSKQNSNVFTRNKSSDLNTFRVLTKTFQAASMFCQI